MTIEELPRTEHGEGVGNEGDLNSEAAAERSKKNQKKRAKRKQKAAREKAARNAAEVAEGAAAAPSRAAGAAEEGLQTQQVTGGATSFLTGRRSRNYFLAHPLNTNR